MNAQQNIASTEQAIRAIIDRDWGFTPELQFIAYNA